LSINNRGDVIGTYNSCCGTRSFLYDGSTGTIRRILGDGASGQFASQINDAGQVAATVDGDGTSAVVRGVRWENGVETDIGGLPRGPNGLKTTHAVAINARGWVVGWSLGSENSAHAVLWDGSTLHDLGAGDSVAMGVNSSGQVVGEANFPGAGSRHAALFENGTVRDLGKLGGRLGFGSLANAINDAGRIVGASATETGTTATAFVYDLPSGPMRDVSPGKSCGLVAVNSSGVAVGQCDDPPGTHGTGNHAAILRGAEVEMLDEVVGDPAWTFLFAQAINDKGQIAGIGVHNGERRGFVLTPR
jgi:probable HAF family extracellular repeat protein